MKKFVLSVLIFSFILFVPVSNNRYKTAAAKMFNDLKSESYSCLLVGFDDSNQNTDVIIIATYSKESNSVSLLQIPRDTYVDINGKEIKINSLYSAFLSENQDPWFCMDRLRAKFENLFGIKLDAYAGYSIDSFVRLIDRMGGVEIDAPNDLHLASVEKGTEIILKKGKNLISGSEALTLVRHRESYELADLSRLEAQKIFLYGLLNTFKENVSIKLLASLMSDKGEGVITNLNTADFINLAVKNKGRISDLGLKIATAPGSVADTKDYSGYYFLSAPSCKALIDELKIPKTGVFDPTKTLKKESGSFQALYTKMVRYKIYDSKNSSSIELK